MFLCGESNLSDGRLFNSRGSVEGLTYRHVLYVTIRTLGGASLCVQLDSQHT